MGVNATKGAVFLAKSVYVNDEFLVTDEFRIQHAFSSPGDLLELMNSLKTTFEEMQPEEDKVAILKCSGGQYGSSVQAIKAETIAELVAIQKDVEVIEIAPQSLKKVLGCGKDHWRKAAQAIFNKDGKHKYWTQGMDGAFCAAYAASKL
jgi:Holliday junction resolvasome RuvABC endonuclease subunit